MSSTTNPPPVDQRRVRSAPLGIPEGDVRPVGEGETDEGATELLEQGVEHYMAHDYERAQQLLERSLRRARRRSDDITAARALGNLASVHMERGKHARAVLLYEQALPIFQHTGDAQRVALLQQNIADARCRQFEASCAEGASANRSGHGCSFPPSRRQGCGSAEQSSRSDRLAVLGRMSRRGGRSAVGRTAHSRPAIWTGPFSSPSVRAPAGTWMTGNDVVDVTKTPTSRPASAAPPRVTLDA